MLIKPVMDYDSEIWNFAITDNNDSLEKIHCKFCKFALGVSKNAGELGCVPLSVCRKLQVVKYWQRLWNENMDLLIYLRETYLLAKSES